MSDGSKEERYEVQGLGLYVGNTQLEDDWTVWLNPEADADFNGICIGAGSTRNAAVANALATLVALVAQLSQPEEREEVTGAPV